MYLPRLLVSAEVCSGLCFHLFFFLFSFCALGSHSLRSADTQDEVWGFFVCLFVFSRVAPEAYGGSQAKGLIRAIATGLHHSHSNTRSEPHLLPISQRTAMPHP